MRIAGRATAMEVQKHAELWGKKEVIWKILHFDEKSDMNEIL